MSSASATLLLARIHGQMLRHRISHGLASNRLLILTIGSFLGLYCVAAYVLVSRGLEFVNRMPLFGPLLLERLIYLLFFFFFVMLVLSNATITGMGMFRRKDMDWQVALPLPYRSLVLWKTLEGMALASWGLLVLSAPILVALGGLYHAGPAFYFFGAPALLCLVTISANLSSWLLLLLVRHAKQWWWKPVALLGLWLLGSTLVSFFTARDPMQDHKGGSDIVSSLHGVLQHTEICMHPLLPSSWVAEVIIASGRGLHEQAAFFGSALLANALFALTLTVGIGGRLFYPAWNRVMAAVPMARQQAASEAWFNHPDKTARPSLMRRVWGLSRPEHASILKDIRTFIREPTQWGQSLLIFGLLLMYTTNLRQLGYDLQSPFWIIVISHLNLLVCCLALSTLTTRFIFPQFSLEGQRMWIIGLSPLSLQRVLSLKLRLSGGVMALLTTALVFTSSLSLALPWQRTVFFCAAVLMLSYGLNALALSLGALLPNFREPNPARIISGFGGTLCLISSFLYILFSATALALPEALRWKAQAAGLFQSPRSILFQDLSALAAVLVLSLIFGAAPYWLAKKRTKSLDYLKEL
ncbi:ABC-2 type transport system permease protein [Prosthecobacter fusiformis]|uniref:ABC-2 type transport system permease protein n=1 Tax=Prosthecobacter fusiformis TaxID=48464 RepID=A0A4R7RP09_9BACT|nr:hypothetical protein [Prosthecobacter fusiformis]TDU67181.1 ABC-2 type transport system permease protein [Prosthecobacter fusiformis]